MKITAKRTCLNCGHVYHTRASNSLHKFVKSCARCTELIPNDAIEQILNEFKTGILWKTK